MAETTEQNEQSLAQKDEAISGEKDIATDPTELSSESVLEEPSGIDKPQASGAEVLSLKDCCREAFGKITEYLNGELAGSIQDYVLLEKLNKLTVTKYSEMSNTAKTLITVMEELDKKYKSLEPYLEQIDKVEESVASLEQAAYRLDAYSKRLEAKFKKLERR
ncbi:hypothetical protein ACROYT_G032026 [Oculina patagonica]